MGAGEGVVKPHKNRWILRSPRPPTELEINHIRAGMEDPNSIVALPAGWSIDPIIEFSGVHLADVPRERVLIGNAISALVGSLVAVALLFAAGFLS